MSFIIITAQTAYGLNLIIEVKLAETVFIDKKKLDKSRIFRKKNQKTRY